MKTMVRSPLTPQLLIALFVGVLGVFVGLPLLGLAPAGKLFSVSSAQASPMEIQHPVGPGEDLHLLAAFYYGDARQWKRIYQANRHQIKNPNRIVPKQTLRIVVPDDWQPLMPFSAWMERLRETPPPTEKPAAKEPKQ